MWRWKWRTTNRQPKLSAFLRQQKQKSVQRIFFAAELTASSSSLQRPQQQNNSKNLGVAEAAVSMFLKIYSSLFFLFGFSLSCGKNIPVICFLSGNHNLSRLFLFISPFVLSLSLSLSLVFFCLNDLRRCGSETPQGVGDFIVGNS